MCRTDSTCQSTEHVHAQHVRSQQIVIASCNWWLNILYGFFVTTAFISYSLNELTGLSAVISHVQS